MPVGRALEKTLHGKDFSGKGVAGEKENSLGYSQTVSRLALRRRWWGQQGYADIPKGGPSAWLRAPRPSCPIICSASPRAKGSPAPRTHKKNGQYARYFLWWRSNNLKIGSIISTSFYLFEHLACLLNPFQFLDYLCYPF